MRTTQLTHKHRSTEPVPAGERPAATRAHRASRASDLPIAAALGLILLVAAAYLALRS
ncbi:hypothetical protein RB608_06365 [Nocardioides sp. LHD-245]|uniref:hypothetical protein n=1 Tax=Nocardioides sp. LHD-245 TaxID=3051387 RepID=UPI0027E1E53F|nr:hypothetical protein [Nocardioides sp. LHD-245]